LVSLNILELSENNLEGPISIEGTYNCNALTVFTVHSNKISGTLPSWLANCTNLSVLDLRNNGFTGELPSYLAKFGKLQILNVGYNDPHDTIPQWITNLTSLFVLDLSNNRFSGRIPSHLERLQKFAINGSSPLAKNVYCEVTIDIKGIEYTVKYMLSTNIIFDLSKNNLMGEILVSIGRMIGL
jgi:Leucine-rich repeat (LRR) protein